MVYYLPIIALHRYQSMQLFLKTDNQVYYILYLQHTLQPSSLMEHLTVRNRAAYSGNLTEQIGLEL